MTFAMDNLCSMCQAGVEHDCSGPRDRHPPRGRGSNYERKEWCQNCDARTTHLYDHGAEMHFCTECMR